MSARNDKKLIEDEGIAFAMYCDVNGLSYEEGLDLAEMVAESIQWAAEQRGDL